MSLFGAMNSSVSALGAQSSAMAAISDNITNVNTTGYKGAQIKFQTIVTESGGGGRYAAGGVQARPRSSIDSQGLLQASASQTDLAVSGNGFFVVNAASRPGAGDQFLFTRAGSFLADSEGYLRNTAGYYLQGWPTDATGKVTLPPDSQATEANQNVISADYLAPINLSRVIGSPVATKTVSLGANLPANDAVGTARSMDARFIDSLGNNGSMTLTFTKAAANAWGLAATPAPGSAAVHLYDADNRVYRSAGQLEFTRLPADGETVTINGITYEFDADGTTGGGTAVAIDPDGKLVTTLRNLVAAIETDAPGFGDPAGGTHAVRLKPGSESVVLFEGGTAGTVGVLAIDATELASSAQSRSLSPAFDVLVQDAALAGQPAVVFTTSGLPAAYNVAKAAVVGFVSGAANMDGADGQMMVLNLGTAGRADGLTQYSAGFLPTFNDQDGVQFGSFTGISAQPDGTLYALFDTGERRPIYKLPLVTFVSPTGLQAYPGNAWAATGESGEPSLREAAKGGAGKIAQSSLEASTVDIGDEFTKMIVVQRAYSAATRVVSTADDMLEELVRIKR